MSVYNCVQYSYTHSQVHVHAKIVVFFARLRTKCNYPYVELNFLSLNSWSLALLQVQKPISKWLSYLIAFKECHS